MEVALSEIKCVALGGLKRVWQVRPPDVIIVDDLAFVKFSPRCFSLVDMVCEDNPHAPVPVPKKFSLTKSLGLQALVKLRNSTHLQAEGLTAVHCNLFENQPQLKKQRISRAAASELRKNLVAVTIGVGQVAHVNANRPLLFRMLSKCLPDAAQHCLGSHAQWAYQVACESEVLPKQLSAVDLLAWASET